MTYQLLMKPKTVSILFALKDQAEGMHLSEIARNTKTTYVFVTNLVRIFAKIELVSIETKGKKKIAKLTEKGFKITNLLNQVKEQI